MVEEPESFFFKMTLGISGGPLALCVYMLKMMNELCVWFTKGSGSIYRAPNFKS